MNRESLELERRNSLARLDGAYKPHLNSVGFSPDGESIEHFLAKAMTAYAIRQGVTADCMQKFFNRDNAVSLDNLNTLKKLSTSLKGFVDFNGQKFKHDWERPVITTESRMKSGERQDITVHDHNQRVEIVESCDKSIVPYNGETVVISI